jgi:hypothetical protein
MPTYNLASEKRIANYWEKDEASKAKTLCWVMFSKVYEKPINFFNFERIFLISDLY